MKIGRKSHRPVTYLKIRKLVMRREMRSAIIRFSDARTTFFAKGSFRSRSIAVQGRYAEKNSDWLIFFPRAKFDFSARSTHEKIHAQWAIPVIVTYTETSY